MEDLINKYGGISNLKKQLNLFYEKICEEKKVKHYFFGINIEHAIQDVVNFRSFVMRKPEHLYNASPLQTAPATIKVRIPVFEDVIKILQIQLQKGMQVNWQDTPRFAYHIMEMFEESRCRSMDSVKMALEPNFVTLDAINTIFTKKQVRTKKTPDGDLMITSGGGFAYPFYIKLLTHKKVVQLVGKGYARDGVPDSKINKILEAARQKFPFYKYVIHQDDAGRFIETSHEATYAAAGLPVRLLVSLAMGFSQRFEEVMALDKDERLINLVRDK